ncbi:MAG: leucine-rich repeat domain-containing protein [Euryarchaeota archaeon]|nr:leucine-rich repeat domain-containing protein [Euryarchaeota archaeon]
MKRRWIALLVLVGWTCSIALPPITAAQEVVFYDENLESAIRAELKKAEGEKIYREALAKMRELDLSNRGIESIEGLENCKNLYNLNLSNNNIKSITPLSTLKSLRVLDLSGNEITDISPLSPLTNLEFLYLGGNGISNIEPLSTLKNLRGLYLVYNTIGSIRPLSELTKLTELDLAKNKVTDILPLMKLTELRELYLGRNDISSIFPISCLVELTKLDLSNNEIRSIAPLSSLKNIQCLNIRQNEIRDITPIKKMTEMGEGKEKQTGLELDLSDNLISDIDPLTLNPGIDEDDTINISNNPLNSKSIERYIPVLQERGVKLIWRPIKNDTPAEERRTDIILLVLALTIFPVLYYLSKRNGMRNKSSKLKKLLNERKRLQNVLNGLESQKEELMVKKVSEERYNELYNKALSKLEEIEWLIEEKENQS